jgi:hypothetical protein
MGEFCHAYSRRTSRRENDVVCPCIQDLATYEKVVKFIHSDNMEAQIGKSSRSTDELYNDQI